jgi:hypothetical protein
MFLISSVIRPRLAARIALTAAAAIRPASTAMMAMTISSSVRVKAERRL